MKESQEAYLGLGNKFFMLLSSLTESNP